MRSGNWELNCKGPIGDQNRKLRGPRAFDVLHERHIGERALVAKPGAACMEMVAGMKGSCRFDSEMSCDFHKDAQNNS